MTKIFEKVLVVGSGSVGSSVISFLLKFGVRNITLSEESENKKKTNNLFGVDTLSSYHGRGGLGNFWHNVIDLGLFDLKKEAGDLNEVFQNISNMSPNLSLSEQEVIPYSLIRPSKLINKFYGSIRIAPRCVSLKQKGSGVQVLFQDGSESHYDRVFLCTGPLNSADVLVNSDLAEKNETVSDHIILYEDKVRSLDNKDQKYIKINRNKGCFLRRYKLTQDYKLTFRPAYSKRKLVLKNKAIYTKSSLRVASRLLNPVNYLLIPESIYLRYGFMVPTRFYRRFIQAPIDNCYFNNNNALKVNDLIIDSFLKKLNDSNISVSKENCVSGIHYYNSIKNLDSAICNVNERSEANIFLMSSSYSFNPGPHHFTFRIIVDSYQILKNLYG
jgi:hypothetical protein